MGEHWYLLIAIFLSGVVVGLIFGPDSERETSARVDGWIDGYWFAQKERRP